MSLPERLGRLRRVDRLGAGGFATVWLYRDDELRSDVAVKALADNWSMRHDIRERFLAEARILRQADSDHVVRVYDIGEESGTPYFVMTYADRGTLANLLEPKQPLEPGRVAELIGQAGDGLSVLHDQGVIHRDIKPQNLLLKSDGPDRQRVLVADLGVAKAVVHASGLTQVVGTPAYMAPEQAMSEGLDIRADVHALAAVAYQMLTARLVREGGIADLLEATTPPPASSIAGVPSRVDDVLERALQPDRELRYPDIRSFVSDLSEACSSDTAIRTRPVARLRAGADAPGSDQTVRRRTDPDRPAKTPPPTTGRSTLVWALAALLVLAGTFALSYLVTTQLR